jgi:hypothetical protein
MNDVMVRAGNLRPLPEPKKLHANLVGYLGWSLVAGFIALWDAQCCKDCHCHDIALDYIDYAQTLATSALRAFYDRDGTKLCAEADYKCLGNSDTCITLFGSMTPNTSTEMGNYDEEMTAYFVYLLADWRLFGGEDARRAFWISRRQFMEEAELATPQGPITVQRGVYYAAWERIGYLFLPFFDVPIVERLFINGERARMYFSAMKQYPGLFSSIETSYNDSSQWYQALGIEVGGLRLREYRLQGFQN